VGRRKQKKGEMKMGKPKTRHNKPKKKPYFISEPFGLPFELQPTGKFKKLSGKKKTKKKKAK
jgi:hypothetical protein